MYFTYVVRPGEAPEGRGPIQEPCWESILHYMLRIGYALQLISHLGLVLLVGFGIQKPLQLMAFLNVSTENIGNTPIWAVLILTGIGMMGYIAHVGYLVLSDDDSSIKQSRGFRAGIKFLTQATNFAIVSSAFTLIAFYTANTFFSDEWIDKNVGTGASWLVYYAARCTDVIALLLYSGAIFFLETYHSEGAGELWGWIIGISYKGAAISEILALSLSGLDGFEAADKAYAIFLLFALLLGFVWSLRFEPISQRYDVRLTQSAMRSEYYKSRNAIAYYGPAVVNADGALDVHNTRIPE